MGAPDSGMVGAEQGAAESLLSSFKTIDPVERRKHATVLNYWLSIRGDREFPPLHDLDPLELTDAGPCSILLELISGGHDAEIRHLGDALRGETAVERLIDCPSPSLLSLIAKKLPIVALSRDFLAFEDQYSTASGVSRFWVTLLPLSACGNWVDYVYAFVSFKTPGEIAAAADAPTPDAAAVAAPEVVEGVAEAVDESVPDEHSESVDEEPRSVPGFSKLFDSLAGLAGFYGQGVKVEPQMPPPSAEEETVVEETPETEELAPVDEAPVEPTEPPAAEPAEEDVPVAEIEPTADEPAEGEAPVAEVELPVEEQMVQEEAPVADLDPQVEEQPAEEEAPVAEASAADEPVSPTPTVEGSLQNKLDDVRAKADEARQAKLRANAALYEGLSAAYDFALDAEDSPEEYLRLVEAQGLKIQLRSPMKPVVKLAFDGMCDDATVKQLEAVLSWAFDEELPRGSLAERIEAAGGIAPILNGQAKAA